MACKNQRTKWPYTFTWTINNFRKNIFTSVKSPEFTAMPLCKTKWSLTLSIAGWKSSTKGGLTCTLQRERDDSKCGELHIELMISILDQVGVLHSVQEKNCCIGKSLANVGDGSDTVSKTLVQVRTLLENFEKYAPDNALTLRFRMNECGGTDPISHLCFARTIMDIEKRSFVWTIGDIWSIRNGQKRTIIVPQYGRGSSSLQLDFCCKRRQDPKVCFDDVFSVEMGEVKNLKDLYCAIATINDEVKLVGDWWKNFRNITFVDKKCILFETFMKKDDLMKDEKRYLRSDTLTLQCDFELSFGVAWNQIENYKQEPFGTDATVNFGASTSSSPRYSCCSSKKILEHLLNEGTMSDITLKAGNKSFPVHQNILSARSIIFRSMFMKKEGQNPNKVLNLSDIDEVTLQSLLIYIYKDVVEDLTFENAFELYQSAEKYQLMDLKNICSKFLIDNLSRSNIFQILSFANVYHDNMLKIAAQDFIAELGNNFTTSGQWYDFKKRNLELAMETVEYMYSSKKRKTEVPKQKPFY